MQLCIYFAFLTLQSSFSPSRIPSHCHSLSASCFPSIIPGHCPLFHLLPFLAQIHSENHAFFINNPLLLVSPQPSAPPLVSHHLLPSCGFGSTSYASILALSGSFIFQSDLFFPMTVITKM